MRHWLLLLLTLLYGFNAQAAKSDSVRTYTQERPLVYEDVWDLWPYSFLNDNGEPEGFNIDLIRLLMDELQIPYVIKLKPSAEAFRDLRDGHSDLMLGLAVGFHDEFGHYSKNAVTLFTQSLVRPKSKPLEIERFHDLSNHQVIVNDSSLAHHLMIEYGWGDNARPVEDMREAIQQVSHDEDGQIIWNTLSLKWLMQRYHTDNLELTPLNMQHGQYKFMSNDTLLLNRLDEAYTRLYSAELLTPIQNKWFYPERQEQPIPAWIWYLTGSLLLIILLFSIYAITYHRQTKRLNELNHQRNKRLALILHTSNVRMWTYDIKENKFAWRNEKGQVAYTYTMEEFSQRYNEKDFQKLKNALERLARQEKDQNEDIAIELRAKDVEGGDTEDRDYYIVLSVLNRDSEGHPTIIIGTKKDITKERQQQRLFDERTLRYWSIFYTPLVGIMMFDKNGILNNINPKGCELLDCDAEEIINEHIHIGKLLDLGYNHLEEVEGYYATLVAGQNGLTHIKSIRHQGKMRIEFKLMTVYENKHNFAGILAIFHSMDEVVESIGLQNVTRLKSETVRQELENVVSHLSMATEGSDVRRVSYSPNSHTLTIYGNGQSNTLQLTQTRCMTLVDEHSKNMAMHILNRMDDCERKTEEGVINTTLRINGRRMVLRFKLQPVSNAEDGITEYQGFCQDISQLRHLQAQLQEQTAKVQEVENTKNSFVKNMVQEIQTPMNTVINYVERLGDKEPTAEEEILREGILENADYLLHLIDNVLYLSRLEAHMVEINKRPCDLAEQFETQCANGWSKYQNDNTRYIVESPYEHLIVDIDAENIGHAVEQLTANAAQHTRRGTVRARYEYIGRRLIISIDDTGEGIPQKELVKLNAQESDTPPHTKGLGLAICKELVNQMGGTVEISSEEGHGTTVYIVIPCQATVVKRKKLIG